MNNHLSLFPIWFAVAFANSSPVFAEDLQQKAPVSHHVTGIGIGLAADPDTDHLVVVGAPPGKPAARSLIARGDFVLAVNGKTMHATDLDFAASQIRGKPNTQVTLTIMHDTRMRDVVLTREDFVVEPGPGCVPRDNKDK